MNTPHERLEQSLSKQFGEDAGDLAGMFVTCLKKELTSYAQIDLPQETKNECLLTAFEDRALIPVQTRPSPSWSACGLRLVPDETYYMPRVVRIVLTNALESGCLEPERAVREVLEACSRHETKAMATLFQAATAQSMSFKVEASLLHNLIREQALDVDLHAATDLFVLAGMMSPCTGQSISSGMAWFELNPSLFWVS